jgi:nucleotide-binding universal stress UspA family protein
MALKIRKILYATDLSKNAAYAFQFAVDLARNQNAGIIILHVIEPIHERARSYVKGLLDDERWERAILEQQTETIARIRKRLQSFCKMAGPEGIPCLSLVSDIMVVPGHPVEEILKIAEQEECDLLVLGTHGKGFLKQTFLGSVARTVLDRVRKPVLTIPLPEGDVGFELKEI